MRVDPFYVQNTLVTALNDATANEASLSEELSSGLRVTSLSTDPVAVGESTVIGAQIAADDSYVSAASNVQSKLQVTDSVLGEVVTALTKAVSLTVSGGNSTLNPSNIAEIGLQLQQIQQQVLTLANTSYAGQYIFGGSLGSTAPFVQNTLVSPQTTTYVGDSALQYTTTENGQKIQTNLPGSTVFTATGADVFASLNRVVADFTSGSNSATIAADSAALTDGLNNVSTQRGYLGNSLSQVESSSTYAQTDAAAESAAQSALLSANPATIATSLSNTETQAQALDNVIAALEKGSLFDYVK
jgi:flagellar hook-associated protein 3 FlgL